MPIQFQCQQCQQWLEVDDEHIGGKAVCPFCQSLSDVPARAAPARLGSESEVPARTGPADQPEPVDQTSLREQPLPSASPDEVQTAYTAGSFEAERISPPGRGAPLGRLGWLGPAGLAASLLGLVLLVLFASVVIPVVEDLVPQDGELTEQDIAALQERFADLQGEKPWLMPVLLGWIGSGMTGVILSLVVLLIPGAPRKGFAWAGLVIGGCPFLCICPLSILRTISS